MKKNEKVKGLSSVTSKQRAIGDPRDMKKSYFKKKKPFETNIGNGAIHCYKVCRPVAVHYSCMCMLKASAHKASCS